jgi:predicted nucleic acid-binding protein
MLSMIFQELMQKISLKMLKMYLTNSRRCNRINKVLNPCDL